VACGAGQGLGYLASVAKSVQAGDITPGLVERARGHYGGRIKIVEMDAEAIPVPNGSLDVVILFEAIYYLSSPERFVGECERILRPEGRVLVVTANKDLYDFNPSPHSRKYYGVPELNSLFSERGFTCDFFGVTPIDKTSLRQRILRPIKRQAVRLRLIPKTMSGKTTLKRLVFGRLVSIPAEIDANTASYAPPLPIRSTEANSRFKAIYLAATRIA
jgi:SAM-dependent methyltransferase